MIYGVCGGFAEYFNADPTIVRIIWILLLLASFGAAILLYLACMLIIPVNPAHIAGQQLQVSPAVNGARKFWGAVLVILGAIILLANLGFPFFHFWHIPWGIIFPSILILIGLYIILEYQRKKREPVREQPEGTVAPEVPPTPTTPPPKELRRSITDRKIFGVCSGLAKYFGADASIVRLLFVVLTLASFGLGILLYLVLAIIVPEERPSPTT